MKNSTTTIEMMTTQEIPWSSAADKNSLWGHEPLMRWKGYSQFWKSDES